jgi:hypothetical protein
MNMLKRLSLSLALGTAFLPGCSGRSTADSPGNDGIGTASGGTSASGGSGSSSSGTANGPAGASAAPGTGSGLPPISVECQSAADCSQGQICCSETMKVGTVCQADPCGTTLLGYPLQFCASDGECVTAGQSCIATMVAGSTFKICRPGTTTGMGGAPSAGGSSGASGSSGAGGSPNQDDLPGAGGAADAAGGASGAGG